MPSLPKRSHQCKALVPFQMSPRCWRLSRYPGGQAVWMHRFCLVFGTRREKSTAVLVSSSSVCLIVNDNVDFTQGYITGSSALTFLGCVSPADGIAEVDTAVTLDFLADVSVDQPFLFCAYCLSSVIAIASSSANVFEMFPSFLHRKSRRPSLSSLAVTLRPPPLLPPSPLPSPRSAHAYHVTIPTVRIQECLAEKPARNHTPFGIHYMHSCSALLGHVWPFTSFPRGTDLCLQLSTSVGTLFLRQWLPWHTHIQSPRH